MLVSDISGGADGRTFSRGVLVRGPFWRWFVVVCWVCSTSGGEVEISVKCKQDKLISYLIYCTDLFIIYLRVFYQVQGANHHNSSLTAAFGRPLSLPKSTPIFLRHFSHSAKNSFSIPLSIWSGRTTVYST